MGLLKWALGYTAAKHLLETTRSQPVNITINLTVEDHGETDHTDDSFVDDGAAFTANVPNTPSSLPVWDKNGRWLMDERGSPVTRSANL